MKLVRTAPPDRGSLAVIYACPACGHELAMLTNPYETQVVASLGVRIGPAAAPAADPAAPAANQDGLSKCPFSEVAREMAGAPEGGAEAVPWTPEARRRLENIPEFVRPMARAGIEKFAREHGLEKIDEEALDRARQFFGM
jgi:hypothetical protein